MNGQNNRPVPVKKARRVVSLWLPNFPIDRANLARRRDRSPDPVAQVTALKEQSALRVAAADPRAQAAGIFPGMLLADARALAPDLQVHEASPADDLRFLAQLADWCGQYSPWTAPEVTGEVGESGYGIWLDVTGCDHLFGGEEALLANLVERVGELGFMARAAMADTPGTAWAAVRYGLPLGEAILVTKPGKVRDVLRRLPVAALRFSPEICAGLERLGLRQAGDLFDLPRGPLVARFGDILIRRVDQALGRQPEPINPQNPPPRYRARLSFAEPIGKLEDLEEATRHLLKLLCGQLEQAGRGLRRLDVSFFRVDGSLTRLGIGTSGATRNATHLLRLLKEHLTSVDAGFGIETITAGALRDAELEADQLKLTDVSRRTFKQVHAGEETMETLTDRLANRLGRRSVRRLRPRNGYMPEKAVRSVPYGEFGSRNGAGDGQWFVNRRRPLSLFAKPEPIEVIAPVPDDPPLMFRWRRIVHRIAVSDGPERIAPDWWEMTSPDLGEEVQSRDYYQVEDTAGDRFWVYRSGVYRGVESAANAQWYLHGLFA